MLPLWPTNTREYIENIIGQIGREVEFFYVYSTYACPQCDLDPITNTSIDSYCETCSGVYWIDVYSGITMSGHVTWRYDSEDTFSTGGKYVKGDAKVKVMHTDERERFIREDVKYLIVDGKTMNIEDTTLLGAPINRIIMDLKEREE